MREPEEACLDGSEVPGRELDLVRELFDAALELPPDQRAAFVARHAPTAPELIQRVESLLAHHDRLRGFLAEPWGVGIGPVDGDSWATPGEVIGGHEIVGLVGTGGSGQVHRARQGSLGGRLVALKLVRADRVVPSDRERFLRGARIAASLHHPHLVEVYDSGEDPARGILYYSMRLVEGPNLHQVLRELARLDRPPSSSVRRKLVRRLREVALALDVLHRRGVVHRDVKPANILLEGAPSTAPWEGRAVLVDYGLLRELSEHSGHSTVWTTPPYSAPEILLQGRADPRSDVYSLGLCAHDLISGRLPSARRDDGPDVRPLSSLVPAIEPDLEAIVHRAIDPDPGRRYSDAGSFAEDLTAFTKGAPVRARRLTRMESARRWLRRNPERVLRWLGRATAYAAGCALLTMGGAYAFDIVTRARALDSALRSGDLLRSAREARSLSSATRGLLIAAGQRTAIRAGEAASAQDLLKMAEESGPERALIHAEGLLERDGLEPHPELLRFMVYSLQAAESAGTRSQTPAVRLAALLFLKRPVLSQAEEASSGELRDTLEALLSDGGTDPREQMYAASALGGCGTARSIGVLVGWLEAGATEPDCMERLRLATHAAIGILRRSSSCGTVAELAALDWDRILEGLAPQSERNALATYGQLAAEAALCRRFAGGPPVRSDPLDRAGATTLEFLAANNDPRLERAVQGSWLDFDRTLSTDWTMHFERVGRVLALHDDPTLVEEARQAIGQGTASGVLPPGCMESMDRGFGDAQAGIASGDHLDRSDLPGGPVQTAELRSWVEDRPAVSSIEGTREVVARWGVGHGQTQCSGSAVGLDRRAVGFGDPTEGEFFCLDAPGTSELVLRFRTSGHGGPFRLRLSIQKAARWLLPYSGQAELDVIFEGQTHGLQVIDTAIVGLDLPFCFRDMPASAVHSLSLRLRSSSTAALWIDTIAIVRPEVTTDRAW